jgi:transcriptional repressor NrdR
MRCPECGCQEDKVVDSRSAKEGEGVRRRRECLNCGHRFTTYEGIIHAELKVVKKNRIREEFDRDKLRAGVERAFYKRPVSGEDIDRLVKKLISGIEADFDGEVSSQEIGNRAMNEIKALDEVAYVRFASVYRQFKDINELLEEIKMLGTRKNP